MEEMLEAYKFVLKRHKIDYRKETQIYNLIAKLSVMIKLQPELTWTQALNKHFNKNLFKARSLRVSHNFIYRKFFCIWIERYLQR
jgi:hypothetical protein